MRVLKLATSETVDEKVLSIASQKALNQRALLGGPASDGGGGRDAEAGLMGSILRELLMPSAAKVGSSTGAAAAAAAAPAPQKGDSADAEEMQVDSTALAAAAEWAGGAEDAVHGEGAAEAEEAAGEEAEEAVGVRERALRSRISERYTFYEAKESSLGDVLADLSSHVGCDLHATTDHPSR